MSDDPSIYEQCVSDQVTGDELLECLANGMEAEIDSLADGIDYFYLIFAGALVYFMQTGFAMLCAGSIRSKNCKNVLLWNLLDSCGGGIAFWSVGYAFAYGGDTATGTTFIGNTNFFLMGDVNYAHWFFNFAFACALSSIVAGTVAERCKMTAYLFYSSFLAGFVYPVVAHSFWSSNGFLANTNENPLWGSGAVDLAGSGPVHMTGGVLALVMAIILGPRMGRFYDADGIPYDEPRDIAGHSVPLQFLGTFCLWFGWYGFNPGSTLMVSGGMGEVAALVAVNTTLGAAAGAISAMFTHTIIEERRTGVATYDLTSAMNGCLTGLVAVTAPCASIEPWAGFLVGVIAGWVYLGISALLVRLKIDDAVDAIPVHFGGGLWGLISVGLFSSPARLQAAFGMSKHVGWCYSWGRGSSDATLLGIQVIAALWIIGWVVAVMGPYIWVLNYFDMLRIDPLEEEVGMDISRHKGPAYEIENVNQGDVDELVNRRSTALETSRSNRGIVNPIKASAAAESKKAENGAEEPAANEEADASA